MTRDVKYRINVLRGSAHFAQLTWPVDSPPNVYVDKAAEIKGSLSVTLYPTTEADLLSDELQPVMIVDGVETPLGVFQAAVKLSVIMNLFIQMFRFAAEPFFFQRAQNKGAKQLYAIVMEYFTAFCGLILLGVFLYLDVFSLIIGKDFRSGMGVVPIMLLSYMLLGMLFNVSMWYKLSGKTNMAIWITLAGLAVTVVVNVIFMPRYSFWAAAFGHLASYLVMFIISAVLGARWYPIPYSWKRIGALFLLIGVICCISIFSDVWLFPGAAMSESGALAEGLKLLLHTILLLAYCAGCMVVLKGRYRQAIAAED